MDRVFKARITPVSGTVPIYQFYHNGNGDHVYSPNINAVAGYSGWQNDGTSFYAYSTQVSGSIPVYAFYNASYTDHYYSSNPNAVANYSGWSSQSVAFYALPI